MGKDHGDHGRNLTRVEKKNLLKNARTLREREDVDIIVIRGDADED